MKELIIYSDDVNAYLEADEIIDFHQEENGISKLAEKIFMESESNLDFVKKAYEYVRDTFPHSADIGNDRLVCTASEVLKEGHGICFSKSHLLAALLRYKGIPTGFCYQKIILDDDTAPYLVLHGLNGVYLEEYDRWIRLDARGNRADVHAQFSLEEERLAFPIRKEKGEEDILVVYPKPDKNVISALKKFQTRSAFWSEIPSELAYK